MFENTKKTYGEYIKMTKS